MDAKRDKNQGNPHNLVSVRGEIKETLNNPTLWMAKEVRSKGNPKNLTSKAKIHEVLINLIHQERNDPRKPKSYTTQQGMPKETKRNKIKILHDTNAKIQKRSRKPQ